MEFPEELMFHVKPTNQRLRTKGYPLVQIQSEVIKELGLTENQLVVIEYKGSKVLGKTQINDQIEERDQCLLDFTLRAQLGMPKLPSSNNDYGIIKIGKIQKSRVKISLRSVTVYLIRLITFYSLYTKLAPLDTRTVQLKISRPSPQDVEKNVAVLRKEYLDLLGLEIGQFITITAPILTTSGYKLSEISIRTFGGIKEKFSPDDEMSEDYPEINRIYLDKNNRNELKIQERLSEEQWPIVMIKPSIFNLFIDRSLLYAITFFLMISQFINLIKFLPFNLSNDLILLLALFLSTWFISLLIYLNIKSKIQF